jgi:adenine-specific DNA glycosylase
MLNCTQRRQVERVLPTFLSRWPTAQALSSADVDDVSALVTPLGFGNRRAVTLIELSRDYLRPGWIDSRVLRGVGQYAGRAHDIFCRGILGAEPPKDHALRRYWEFATSLQPLRIRRTGNER